MTTAATHYDQLLGPIYTWMAGGWEAAVTRNRALLAELGLADWPRGTAVDLGCGSGFQAVPLAEAGYDVVALDLNETLLGELRGQVGSRAIRTVRADLRAFPDHLAGPAALIVCMGDTLTHLPTVDDVRHLVAQAAAHLQPGGRLVLGYRDLAATELTGAQRFLPVRSEPDRLFTCFLEYHPGYVDVHDLLHERTGETWSFRASSYRKLRLPAAEVMAMLADAGLQVERHSANRGLVHLVATRG